MFWIFWERIGNFLKISYDSTVLEQGSDSVMESWPTSNMAFICLDSITYSGYFRIIQVISGILKLCLFLFFWLLGSEFVMEIVDN